MHAYVAEESRSQLCCRCPHGQHSQVWSVACESSHTWANFNDFWRSGILFTPPSPTQTRREKENQKHPKLDNADVCKNDWTLPATPTVHLQLFLEKSEATFSKSSILGRCFFVYPSRPKYPLPLLHSPSSTDPGVLVSMLNDTHGKPPTNRSTCWHVAPNNLFTSDFQDSPLFPNLNARIKTKWLWVALIN